MCEAMLYIERVKMYAQLVYFTSIFIVPQAYGWVATTSTPVTDAKLTFWLDYLRRCTLLGTIFIQFTWNFTVWLGSILYILSLPLSPIYLSRFLN